MRRADVRRLKQAVVADNCADAMLQLLQRSVRFGHKKLALARCLQAERLGVLIAPDILSYCQQVADATAPEVLHEILKKAALNYDTPH